MQAWEWALELRNELEEFWLSPVGQRFGRGWTNVRIQRDQNMPPIQQIEAIKLPIAAPFYVTTEMTDLLIHAAETFPETEFRPEDLPLEAGFVYFAKPIPTIDIHLKPVPWRAFSWGTAYDDDGPWGVHLAIYDHRDERSVGAYAPDEEDIGLHDIMPTLGLNHETTWRFGKTMKNAEWGPGTIYNQDTPIPKEAQESGTQMMQTIHAFWLLCWQKIAVPQAQTASRGVRRRTERAFPGRPIPEVRVVTLRRPKERPEGMPDRPGGREYSHRWWVNGFWRRQWYSSEGRHKPKYIEAHVRGPKDKPLVVKETTYLWRR
jgi:hypothetical protein